MSKISMFDRFPNELLHDVFQYLTAFDTLYAFKGLNIRIDTLLRKYVKYDLNFQSWSKTKFDFVCQSISPEQIQSLILSNHYDTCRQIHLFFNLFYIPQFINLKSLTLIEITEQELNKIVTKLNYLSKLSYLSIKLIDGLIPQITLVSTLKYLSIGTCSIHRLQQLLLCTPSLTNLNVQLIADNIPTSDICSSEIRQLKIELFEKSNIIFDHLRILFIWMPKLIKLTFIAEKGFIFIDGHQWEYLIRTYLSQLKEFHFKIHPNLTDRNIQQLLSTFQTSFWLKEKQWLIHCDHHYIPNLGHHNIQNIHLYTLPYCDKQFYLNLSTETKTNVNKNEYYSIKDLYFSIDSHHNKVIMTHYYFPNLDSLTIRNLHKLKSIDNLINLSQIKHLTIEQNNTINSEEFLLYILIHSTQLQSLELSWYTLVQITNNFTDQQVCSLLNKQIKYLNVLNMIPNDGKDNRKSIEILIEIFSTNLEKLSFSVTSMDYIPMVLSEMVNLYSVQIECNTMMNDNNELSLWLMRNIPKLKNFTHQIRPATQSTVYLILWIGQ